MLPLGFKQLHIDAFESDLLQWKLGKKFAQCPDAQAAFDAALAVASQGDFVVVYCGKAFSVANSVIKVIKDLKVKKKPDDSEDKGQVCKMLFKNMFAIKNETGDQGVAGSEDVEQLDVSFLSNLKLGDMRWKARLSAVGRTNQQAIKQLPPNRRSEVTQVTATHEKIMLDRDICTIMVDKDLLAKFKECKKTNKKFRGMKMARQIADAVSWQTSGTDNGSCPCLEFVF